MKNIKIRKIFTTITLCAVLAFPFLSFAQTSEDPGCNTCDPTGGKICNPITVCSIADLIKTILEGVIKIGIPVIALAIVYCGFLFVSARGNSEKLKTAKSALMYTLIGAAILLGSWAIAQLISETVLAL